MAVSKKKAEITKQCVACGCCVKVCPLNVISVHKGKYAVVDDEKCVGCAKCVNACPAFVISIAEREVIEEAAKNAEEALV